MRLRFVKIGSLLTLSFALHTSCVEELNLETETVFENALVVEATITNEFKQQSIKLTRTYATGNSGPVVESDAIVKIIGGDGNVFQFQEQDPGEYKSNIEFAAVPNVEYQLEIITSDGHEYESNKMTLTQNTTIDNLYISRGFNENDDEGVSVFVDAFDPSNNSSYYRFEFEETYKIIVPQYSPWELVIVNRQFPFPPEVLADPFTISDYLVTKELRPEQEQICYNTSKSKHIITTTTSDQIEDRLDQYRVHFINRNNYIISYRYSILVRQFVQSFEAFSYYDALNNLSETESILSETQPGFLQGNLYSTTHPNEKVIGFFETASVDSKRIFFNYSDVFPGEELPPYVISCNEFVAPPLWNKPPDDADAASSSPLIQILDEGLVYFDDNPQDNEAAFPYAPFLLVQPECGDCTVLGTTSIPEFWIE